MEKRIQKVYKTWTKDSKNRGDRKITVSAPDTDQNKLYQNCLKKSLKGRKNPLILVLGATPELRNMVMDFGYRVLAADINYDMIFNLEHNIKNKNNLNNMIMRANWLDLDKLLQINNFDAVIGDGVIGQLDPAGIRKLIKVVRNLLKPKACFITRIDVYFPDYPVLPFIDLLKQWRKKDINFLQFGIRSMLYSDYSNKFYDKKKKLMYTYKFWEVIDDLYKKRIITKQENEFIQKRKMNLTHYMLPKKELYKNILEKYFQEIPLKQFDETWPTYMGIVKK